MKNMNPDVGVPIALRKPTKYYDEMASLPRPTTSIFSLQASVRTPFGGELNQLWQREPRIGNAHS